MRTSENRIQLAVQGDDFEMCHTVNTGTVQAFREGILTQASTMVPCPWFWEAADPAKRHRIPLGIHSTLTCEWDGLLRAAERLADGSAHAERWSDGIRQ
jgi:predicted glycoside hydrolase/deacetylase ChbG (UPF0249 family)